MNTAPFGRGGRPRQPRTCIEDVPRIEVKNLAASLRGPLARKTVTVAVNGAEMALDVVRDARFFGGDGQRYFLCPTCSRKVWHLYLPGDGGRLVCRRCADLEYASQHTSRQGINRARRLREKIGAAPGLLSPIPSRPAHVRRDYWMKALARIAVAEAALAAELHAIIPRVRKRLKP